MGGNETAYNLGHDIGIGIKNGLEAIGTYIMLFW